MKISREKQIAFLERIIADTQSHSGAWNRMMSDCIAASNVFPNEHLDAEGVFSYMFPHELRGQFWIAMCKNGKVKGAIGTETTQMEYFDTSDEEISILLTRLFYLLFDSRANANKLIDEFLSLGQTGDSNGATS